MEATEWCSFNKRKRKKERKRKLTPVFCSIPLAEEEKRKTERVWGGMGGGSGGMAMTSSSGVGLKGC
jgi:hypothetical protein